MSEAQNKLSRLRRYRRSIVAVLALLPVLYVASLFVLAFLGASGTISSVAFDRWINLFAEAFYSPLFWYQESGLPGAETFNDWLISVIRFGKSLDF